MSSSKKRKLSLKKTGAATLKSSTQAGNTIVSMFKQQVDRETRFEGNKESGSEGDVVITNVIGLDKGKYSTKPECEVSILSFLVNVTVIQLNKDTPPSRLIYIYFCNFVSRFLLRDHLY